MQSKPQKSNRLRYFLRLYTDIHHNKPNISLIYCERVLPFMALNYGRRTPITVMVAHLLYGAILGAFYRLK